MHVWAVHGHDRMHATRWKVMVITHEDASEEETMPYLGTRLFPMVVKEFFGRAAKREPPCKAQHCVWHWWKDLCLCNDV